MPTYPPDNGSGSYIVNAGDTFDIPAGGYLLPLSAGRTMPDSYGWSLSQRGLRTPLAGLTGPLLIVCKVVVPPVGTTPGRTVDNSQGYSVAYTELSDDYTGANYTEGSRGPGSGPGFTSGYLSVTVPANADDTFHVGNGGQTYITVVSQRDDGSWVTVLSASFFVKNPNHRLELLALNGTQYYDYVSEEGAVFQTPPTPDPIYCGQTEEMYILLGDYALDTSTVTITLKDASGAVIGSAAASHGGDVTALLTVKPCATTTYTVVATTTDPRYSPNEATSTVTVNVTPVVTSFIFANLNAPYIGIDGGSAGSLVALAAGQVASGQTELTLPVPLGVYDAFATHGHPYAEGMAYLNVLNAATMQVQDASGTPILLNEWEYYDNGSNDLSTFTQPDGGMALGGPDGASATTPTTYYVVTFSVTARYTAPNPADSSTEPDGTYAFLFTVEYDTQFNVQAQSAPLRFNRYAASAAGTGFPPDLTFVAQNGCCGTAKIHLTWTPPAPPPPPPTGPPSGIAFALDGHRRPVWAFTDSSGSLQYQATQDGGSTYSSYGAGQTGADPNLLIDRRLNAPRLVFTGADGLWTALAGVDGERADWPAGAAIAGLSGAFPAAAMHPTDTLCAALCYLSGGALLTALTYDGGENWTPNAGSVATGLDFSSSGRAGLCWLGEALCCAFWDGARVAFRASPDRGRSWGTATTITTDAAVSLSLLTFEGGLYLLATDAGAPALWRSGDMGMTWKAKPPPPNLAAGAALGVLPALGRLLLWTMALTDTDGADYHTLTP